MKENRDINIKRLNLTKEEIINDYRIAYESRQMAIMGRREVLTGKANFGLFGDGKEIPQLAMAKVFRNGDWRSGYYRDQTFMLATGLITIEQLFSQLYGEPDIESNPANGGRLMNNHFGTRSLDENGEWKDLTKQKNSAIDSSPTASQMPRLLGLAYASRVFKNVKELQKFDKFSDKGNEVAFGTIGDASTSEGHFFETLNAAAVSEVPMVISVWDDQWGISVHNRYQTTKGSISEILKGFKREEGTNGIEIFVDNCNDYLSLVDTYRKGVEICRKEHIPVLFHIKGCTQPLGHSTSGSHERYKTVEQLQDEEKRDGLKHMRKWMTDAGIATEKQLQELERQAVTRVKEAKKRAWKHFINPIIAKRNELISMINIENCNCGNNGEMKKIIRELELTGEPLRRDVYGAARRILRIMCDECIVNGRQLKRVLSEWLEREMGDAQNRYSSHLYSQSQYSALKVKHVPVKYGEESREVPGREILRDNFDYIFKNNPLVLAFGEDVGKIGGVNQTYEGLQKKYGKERIFDTGIREATIVGQGFGMALRGLRPIAEIQYFDYLLYGLQVMSDDLATLHYRTAGGQKAPVIISTRGHRLVGIWHSGSPLSMVINSIRGMHVAVPRNMTEAAGFYNTYLASDQPVLIIEPLNGYRLREKYPLNIGQYNIPAGVPEILNRGDDVTLVTYGSCVRIAQTAVNELEKSGVGVELIDVRTLIPFDVNGIIKKSLEKTNKIIFMDEDVPGGATAFMMQKVLEEQKAFYLLDMEPETVTAKAHRAAYSPDGDYFSNPNSDDVFEAVYSMMNRYNPSKYPPLF